MIGQTVKCTVRGRPIGAPSPSSVNEIFSLSLVGYRGTFFEVRKRGDYNYSNSCMNILAA